MLLHPAATTRMAERGMAALLLPLIVPAGAGGLGWWFAHLCAPLKAANDNGPVRVTLPHPQSRHEEAR